jgi:hypothetical protein
MVLLISKKTKKQLETLTWSQPITTGTKPPFRSNACAAIISRKMYYHGGTSPISGDARNGNEEYTSFDDLHVLDLGSNLNFFSSLFNSCVIRYICVEED